MKKLIMVLVLGWVIGLMGCQQDPADDGDKSADQSKSKEKDSGGGHNY